MAGPGLWLRHGPGGAPRFLLFFLSGQRPRAATAAARNGASRAEGGGHGARTHRGGRTQQAERGGRKDTKIVSERRKQPRARGRPGPQLAWARRAWIGRTSPAVAASGPESSAPVACAVNQSRSLTLAPPHRVSPIRAGPAPGRTPPPLPIGCKRASRPRTALVRLTQVPRPPPAGGAASLGPSLLPASLCFFSSTPFPPDHGFLVPNRNGRQRLSLGPRSRRTGL